MTTKAEKMAEAYKWLDKAIGYEAEKKNEKFIEMALKKACQYELEANSMKD